MPNEKKYIDADKIIKLIEKYGLANGGSLGHHNGIADIIAALIKNAPAADVAEDKHGYWVPVADGEMPECSECGETYDTEPNTFDAFCTFYRYCPNCGARMDGGEENA